MTRQRTELQAALMLAYARSQATAGRGAVAWAYLQRRLSTEARPVQAGHLQALYAAGLLTKDGTLTPEGKQVLAGLLA